MSLPTLKLHRECKLHALLPDAREEERLEASGLLLLRGQYFVVFDNLTQVARIAKDLRASKSNGLFGNAPDVRGYEGIAYNPATRRFYLLVESIEVGEGLHEAKIVEYSTSHEFKQSRRVDYQFKTANKGFEALAYLRRDGRDYALALCEGNRCRGGREGRQKGHGRVQVFQEKRRSWSHVATIKLPKSVTFEDYSGMALDGTRVAIVSQENSLLWIGRFEKSTWAWRDNGQLYEFPRTGKGKIRYGNVEGVCWITRRRIATVSDRRKKKRQPKRVAAKDQSIHVFDIPR